MKKLIMILVTTVLSFNVSAKEQQHDKILSQEKTTVSIMSKIETGETNYKLDSEQCVKKVKELSGIVEEEGVKLPTITINWKKTDCSGEKSVEEGYEQIEPGITVDDSNKVSEKKVIDIFVTKIDIGKTLYQDKTDSCYEKEREILKIKEIEGVSVPVIKESERPVSCN